MNYNIEFAHIYVNESFSSEHYQAINLLRKQIRDITKSRKKYSTILLVDDYNPTEWLLDLDKVLQELKEQKINPDFVVLESSLVQYVPDLLQIIKDNHIDINQDKMQKNSKYRCSFLLAIWYLMRLGLIKLNKEKNIFYRQNVPIEKFIADELINILPQRFMAVERIANQFIKKINLINIEEKNQYIFY